MHLRKIKKREGGSVQDDSEVGESKLWSRDLLCSSWRHTHMDIMSTFPSSFDAMNGCVYIHKERERERLKNNNNNNNGFATAIGKQKVKLSLP